MADEANLNIGNQIKSWSVYSNSIKLLIWVPTEFELVSLTVWSQIALTPGQSPTRVVAFKPTHSIASNVPNAILPYVLTPSVQKHSLSTAVSVHMYVGLPVSFGRRGVTFATRKWPTAFGWITRDCTQEIEADLDPRSLYLSPPVGYPRRSAAPRLQFFGCDLVSRE